MPWVTPTLDELRALNRDNVQSQLRSGPIVPNSVVRVMADSNAGLAYLTLLYLNWLALQLLPDTAETEWLDRHGNIWLPAGRKIATVATGTMEATGIQGTPIPSGTKLIAQIGNGLTTTFQTTSLVNISSGPTPVPVVALTAGQTNLDIGSQLSFIVGIAGVDGNAAISAYADGVNEETDDELRVRVLERIRQPPMGGDAEDYVAWAMQVPAVTRAWCSPLEMGPGTVTVRFMMDDLRLTDGGFPNTDDIATTLAYINTVRPVAIKDLFVLAPVPYPIDFVISELNPDNDAMREAIALSVHKMLVEKAAPAYAINGLPQAAQTIYAAWVSEAISETTGVVWFNLGMVDQEMPSSGYLGVLGTITYNVG